MERKFRVVPTLQVVSEEDITNFCDPCENLRPDNSCRIDQAGGNDQARYVASDWCGWASVNDVRGSMTRKGFHPNFGNAPSTSVEQPK